ncbi:sensor histidine kinase [Vagococcus acidifermentans]|uniref:histidine kinase n=1 Tax=Vagococcus acidifermentans TaxID=564710 RepID=A0A430AVG8_9ENTE|nr:ATP-binding protein [Vagococcus acidifermentans]RSU12060.1 hypothetical protein CBF27_06440 [Vagococcus acidifermentans]
MKKKLNIQLKYILPVIGVVALFLAGALYTNHFFRTEVIDQQKNALSGEIDLLLPFLSRNGQLTLDQERLDDSMKDMERLTVLDAEASIVYDSSHAKDATGRRESRPEIQQILIQGKDVGFSLRDSETIGEELLYVAKPIVFDGQLIGIVRYSEKFLGFSQRIDHFRRNIFLLFFVLSVAILIMFYHILKRNTQPITYILPILKNAAKNPQVKQQVVNAPSEWQAFYQAAYELMDETNSLYYKQLKNETKLQFLFENLEIGLFILDKDGYMVLANVVTEKLFDRTFSHAHYQDWFRQRDMNDLINQLILGERDIQGEIHLKGYGEKHLKVVLRVLKSETVEFVGIIYDISGIRKMERLHQDFISNISHELKTPTTSIVGFTETLLNGAMYDAEATKEFLTIIDNEANRLYHLIQNILMLLRTEKDVRMTDTLLVTPESIVQEEVKRYDRQIKEKQLAVSVAIQLASDIAVPSYAFQIIAKNIIENAVVYTEDKGKIDISLTEDDNYLIFNVTDTGVGISKEDQKRIFERFYRVSRSRQRNKGGSGLGLSIVEHYTELLNGRVDLKSTLGKGTDVTITLPK